jgi:ribosome maturation factor RimP
MNRLENQKPLPVVGAAANSIVTQVWHLAEPLCRSEGLILVFVEYQRETSGLILRLYLDKSGGVTLDDCANVSRQLSDLLDVRLETDSKYRLEVSSPGMQRPLGRLSDFEQFKGEKVKIKSRRPVNGQKNFTGILDGTSEQSIRILVDSQAVSIALDDIKRANLIHYNGES